MISPQWLQPPDRLSLCKGEVHVWQADLDAAIAHLTEWQSLLAVDEMARADRFHFPEHRHHFICGRGLLRTILAKYLNLEPNAIAFGYGSHGKPFLAPPSNPANQLSFNLSHSQGLALYIVTLGRDVGIDVERIASERNVTEIITRFFTRSERAYLLNLPTAERQTAFFRCWTCKEAQVKATGQGISEGLTQLDLAAMLKTAESLTYCDPWSIATLDLDDRWRDRYAAAIAVAGQNWQLKCWRYN